MEDFINQYLLDPTIGRLVAVGVGVIAVIVLVRFLQRISSKHIKEPGSRYRARKAMAFFGYVAAIAVVATVYSDRLGGITVALGVAGAGITFALQELIASIAGWFAIAFAKFYKTGDRVQLGGIKGDVIDIGMLRTTVMEIGGWVDGDLYNGRVVRVANSFVFKEPVFNYSGDFPFLWDEIVVPIAHGSNLTMARDIISNAAKAVLSEYASSARLAWDDLVVKYPIENARVDPMITMVADQNWVSFTLRYVVEYKQRRSTKDTLFSQILAFIGDSDGAVQIAGATLMVALSPTTGQTPPPSHSDLV